MQLIQLLYKVIKCILVLLKNFLSRASLPWKIKNGYIWEVFKLRMCLGIRSFLRRGRLWGMLRLLLFRRMASGAILLSLKSKLGEKVCLPMLWLNKYRRNRHQPQALPTNNPTSSNNNSGPITTTLAKTTSNPWAPSPTKKT